MAEILSIFGEFGTLFLVLYKYLHVIEEFDLLLTKSQKEKSRELDFECEWIFHNNLYWNQFQRA